MVVMGIYRARTVAQIRPKIKKLISPPSTFIDFLQDLQNCNAIPLTFNSPKKNTLRSSKPRRAVKKTKTTTTKHEPITFTNTRSDPKNEIALSLSKSSCTIISASTIINFHYNFTPVRLFCTVRSLILLVFTPLYGYFTLYYYSVPETNITLMPSF